MENENKCRKCGKIIDEAASFCKECLEEQKITTFEMQMEM